MMGQSQEDRPSELQLSGAVWVCSVCVLGGTSLDALQSNHVQTKFIVNLLQLERQFCLRLV